MSHKSKVLTVILLGMLLISSTTLASDVPIKDELWNQIAEHLKFSIFAVDDFSDDIKLSIAGFHLNQKTAIIFWPDKSDEILNSFEAKFPERDIFIVFVQPNGNQYFWPSQFTFTQNNTQYNINAYSDVAKLHGPFKGELKSGTGTVGAVAVPKGIDLDEKFSVWYGDDRDWVPSFNNSSSGG